MLPLAYSRQMRVPVQAEPSRSLSKSFLSPKPASAFSKSASYVRVTVFARRDAITDASSLRARTSVTLPAHSSWPSIKATVSLLLSVGALPSRRTPLAALATSRAEEDCRSVLGCPCMQEHLDNLEARSAIQAARRPRRSARHTREDSLAPRPWCDLQLRTREERQVHRCSSSPLTPRASEDL